MLLKRSWILQEDGELVKFQRRPVPNYDIRFAFCIGCKYFSSPYCTASGKINKVCNKYRGWINGNKPKTPPTYIICS